MDEVQRLVPLVLLQLVAPLPPVVERDDAAGRHPEDGREDDNGHWGTEGEIERVGEFEVELRD